MKINTSVIDGITLKIKEFEKTTCIIAYEEGGYNSSIGGCRFQSYKNLDSAIADIILLVKSMSKKTKILNLSFNGGKSIIIKNNNFPYKNYAIFLNELNGKYITGCDIGTYPEIMHKLSLHTKYVSGVSTKNSKKDYLSYFTALGAYECIKFMLLNILGKNISKSLILIQGAGKVGSALAKIFIKNHIEFSICDMNEIRTYSYLSNKKVTIVDTNAIYNSYDVLVPCASGNVVTAENVSDFSCKLICGPANNQIENIEIEETLNMNKIYYISDFLVGCGGVFYAAQTYSNLNFSIKSLEKLLLKKLNKVLIETFSKSIRKKINISESINNYLK